MTTVLVVDDNPIDRRMAGGCVEEEQMSVRYAEDGRQALEMIASDPPDIVLTDLDMPIATAWNLCGRSSDMTRQSLSF